MADTRTIERIAERVPAAFLQRLADHLDQVATSKTNGEYLCPKCSDLTRVPPPEPEFSSADKADTTGHRGAQ